VTDSPPALERWLPVPGYEGFYEVSDLGRVRSLARQGTYGRTLKPIPDSHGYLRVVLSCDKRRRGRYVHQLVLLAFIGPCPTGHEVRHGPAGKLDNRLSNLSYGTYRGEGHHQSKLTELIVLECRRRAAAGEQQLALAHEFGISQSAMNAAIRGKTWSHLI
jgi:hypothetical protein